MKAFTFQNVFFLLLIAIASSMFSCNTSKRTAGNDFGKPLSMPCDGRKFQTDKEFVRTSQIAKSSDLTLSREKALLVTQQRLGSIVESSLRSAVRRYANERTVTTDYDFAEQMETMVLTSVRSTTQLMNIVCEEVFVSENGIYTTAIALELEKSSILDAILTRQNRDKYFRLEEDLERFREIFEEETGTKASR